MNRYVITGCLRHVVGACHVVRDIGRDPAIIADAAELAAR